MRLLIDAGNTRIKWALVRGADWLRFGAVDTAAVNALSGELAGLTEVRGIRVSNVAGDAVAQAIRALQLGPHGAPNFLTATPACAGVRNGYAHPAQLGSDRWAALIAAWHIEGRACLVVNAGTATTIDTLRADGMFIGGLILPFFWIYHPGLLFVGSAPDIILAVVFASVGVIASASACEDLRD